MTDPKLAVAASGYGGRGYRDIFREGQPTLMSITTALNVLDKGGIVQWSVDQTAAYAAANIDALLNRTEEQGYNMLRWYHKRAKERDFDDPEVDIHNFHSGVLNDTAELGTAVHDWIECYTTGQFEPDLIRDEQVQMVEQFVDWYESHDVKVIATEATVFGNDYAGTLDAVWEIDGTRYLVEVKTSRAVRESHIAQMAAQGAGLYRAVEVAEGTPGAVRFEKKGEVSWWVQEPVPDFQKYAVLRVRPDDYNHKGEFVPAHVHFEEISQEEIDAGWDLFQSAVNASLAKKALKDATKKREGK